MTWQSCEETHWRQRSADKCLWQMISWVEDSEALSELVDKNITQTSSIHSHREVCKVWSGVDLSRTACWSRQREDDTRFILESCEDTEPSREWSKDKERYVRVIRVCVCERSSVCIYKDCEERDPSHACRREVRDPKVCCNIFPVLNTKLQPMTSGGVMKETKGNTQGQNRGHRWHICCRHMLHYRKLMLLCDAPQLTPLLDVLILLIISKLWCNNRWPRNQRIFINNKTIPPTVTVNILSK